MSSAIAVTAATIASYAALAAADHSPPAWMWAALVAVNAATLGLAYRNRVA